MGAARNAVLVTVDSLRTDVPGTGVTPRLDALARRGTSVETAVAGGNWTPFSFPGLLGGRPVFVDGPGLGPGSAPTLAERLSAADRATAGFNAANGFLTPLWEYDRGFDRFEAFLDEPTTRYGRYMTAHPTVRAWRDLAASPVRRLAASLAGEADDRPFTDTAHTLAVERRATDFVETMAATDTPFFLWVHYMDAHTPYVPALRYLRETTDVRLNAARMLWAHLRTGLGRGVGDRTLATLRSLYRAAVRQADDSLGRLLDGLETAGVRDETVVAVAGDHGEEFMEHGHLAHYPKLHRELVHVPLVIDAPDGVAGRLDGPVGLDAVPPTLCDLLDVPVPDGWTGRSLAPAVRAGETDGTDRPVVSVTVRGESVTTQPIPRHPDEGDLLVAARTGRWTYVENAATGEERLYDRREDPGETEERLATGARPAALGRLRTAARERTARIERAVAGGGDRADADAGEGVATRLRALGYR
jgi:arylsulfatase A-like enzyme